MKILTMLAAVSMLVFTTMALSAQTSYVVVVSGANSTDSMAKAEVAKLFLKKTTKWDSGLAARPVDQTPSRPVRESFTRSVHGRSVSAIKAHWQKMIFSGRGTPPLELDSDSKVLDYVRKHPGAIGYVSADATIGEGVKILRLTSG